MQLCGRSIGEKNRIFKQKDIGMKKWRGFIKTYDIDVILSIILIVGISAFFNILDCYDELWNFANAYKMFEGYTIYKELNVIVTPLFFYIAQLFFKIFGATLLSFRIYNFVISSILIILIYKILGTLKIVRRRAIFYTLLIGFLISSLIKGRGKL